MARRLLWLLVLVLVAKRTSTFTPLAPHHLQPRSLATTRRQTPRLWATLPDISSMKSGEMRKELESYGISTKAFLEKLELKQALQRARDEGMEPQKTTTTSSSGKSTASRSEKTTARSSDKTTSSSDKTSGVNGDTLTRKERIQKEMEKAKSMKVGDLKKELQDRGISTKSFFEKSEFVRAYAEAIVDGTQKKAGGAQGARGEEEEAFDPSYRDVIMQKMNARDPRLLQGTVIDIPLRK